MSVYDRRRYLLGIIREGNPNPKVLHKWNKLPTTVRQGRHPVRLTKHLAKVLPPRYGVFPNATIRRVKRIRPTHIYQDPPYWA
jgi:hypothetical protein